MKNTGRSLHFIFCVLILFCYRSDAQDNVSLKGDSTAVAIVEKMLQQMGGAEIWARSKHLYIEQNGWFTEPAEAAIEKTWRDLTGPRQRMHIVGRFAETTFVYTESEAWVKRKDVISDFPKDRHEAMVNSWNHGSYTMFTRFANKDQDIVLSYTAPHRITISDLEGNEISWYDINEEGHWMKWGRSLEDDGSLEYVYGPLRDFGNIRFPAWGAAVDGNWRYTYIDVRLNFESLDPVLLVRPMN